MKIHYLPLEPLEERYTKQMLGWVISAIETLDYPHTEYLPNYEGGIEQGQWLDICKTFEFKSRQLAMVADAFRKGDVKSGDVFLLGDLWFPGIEQIKTMAELMDIQIKIGGWHYAGVFDEADLLHRKLGAWSRQWESSMLDMVDLVCCGSYWHKSFLSDHVSDSDKLRVHGLSWNPTGVRPFRSNEKENIVIFPHRLAPEKNPLAFVRLARWWNQHGTEKIRFVISSNRRFVPPYPQDYEPVEFISHETKGDYYRLLAKCKWFYSAALQETFGYALHEAITLGVSVIAPYRCSYPEMLNYDRKFLYDPNRDPDGCNLFREQVTYPLEVGMELTERFAHGTENFIQELVSL